MNADELRAALRLSFRALPDLLQQPTRWNSLDVLYDTPRVQRLWLPFHTGRLYLHRIYPCSAPFYHPHPWPSIVFVVGGRQRMDVGVAQLIVASTELSPGSSYVMDEPEAFHAVNPIGGPSLSVMFTGAPWPKAPRPSAAERKKNVPLSDEVKLALLEAFESATSVWSP